MNDHQLLTCIVFTGLVIGGAAVHGQATAEERVFPVTGDASPRQTAELVGDATEQLFEKTSSAPKARPPAITPSATDDDLHELARKMNAALMGNANVPKTRLTDAKPKQKVWSCGEWEELWQGRGSARTCVWR